MCSVRKFTRKMSQLHFVVLWLFYGLNLVQAGPVFAKGRDALDDFPLIDGHNDLAYNLYSKVNNQIKFYNFTEDLSDDPVFGSKACDSCFTDMARLKKGKARTQFWSAYVSCSESDPVTRTLEQIDVIKRLVQAYPQELTMVTTADGITDAFKNGKFGSLIGVEGGHSIANSMAVLRLYYELGVRYMTLTHTCNLAWADSATVDSTNSPVNNLTDFGKKIVLEMNRLGMLVDLAHVSRQVMIDAITTSKAPVIFSHSSSRAVYDHVRNVDDYVLGLLKKNNGVVMVNFYSGFVAESNATITDVIKHINHIVDVIGPNHVGIGADYDGVTDMPKGLDDVSHYAELFDKLKTENSTRWTKDNLINLAGRNLVRVFKAAEEVKASLSKLLPDDDILPVKSL